MEKGSIAIVFSYGLVDFNLLMKDFIMVVQCNKRFWINSEFIIAQLLHNPIIKKNLVNILKLFKGSCIIVLSN